MAAAASSPGARAQADPRPRHGHDLVRGAHDRRGVDPQHRDGGSRPHAVRDRTGSDRLESGDRPGFVEEILLGVVGALPSEPAQPRDRDVAVIVVQLRDHPRESRDRVRDGATEGPAVLCLIQHTDLDHAVGDATDARRDRGDARPVVPGVADHRHVGTEQIRVPPHELGEVGGGAFLLALDQELHRDGHVAGERPKRCGVDHDPRLVVGGASPVQAAVANLGFERRRVPLLERAFRLDVVVGVQEHGRRALGPVDLAEDRRMPPVELQEPGVRHPRRVEDVARGFGRRPHVRRVVARVSLRWDPHQLLQVRDGLRHAGCHTGTEVVGAHGRERYRVVRRAVRRASFSSRRGSRTTSPAARSSPVRTRPGSGCSPDSWSL